MDFSRTSKLLVATLFSVAISPLAFAKNPDYSGWSWSANLDSLHISKDVAAREYVGTDAFMFGFAAEHYSNANNITIQLGANFIAYDDKADFSQNTTDGRKSSDASAMMMYVEAGPRFTLGADDLNFVTVKAGVSGIFSSERGISYCSNCYSSSINIDGGAYGVLGVGHSFNSLDVALNLQQYFTGDLDNSLSLKFSSRF